uniref:RING-type domain-containing protein n=1 Tax=Terrapene triunguis TaxID=2587831 RepID=A0A674IJ30_9SAUR
MNITFLEGNWTVRFYNRLYFKKGNMDVDSEGESCVVCLEAHKPRERVHSLTCKQLFHKRCFEFWLSKHKTCPEWNCDILKVN